MFLKSSNVYSTTLFLSSGCVSPSTVLSQPGHLALHLFVISTRRFSNFYISVFLVAGIYYDALYSSNILGFSSAKFLITIILMNFIVANQQNNTYLDLATFTVGIFIYKFTYSLEYLNPEFLYQILISSLVNYFLFRILNITIGKNVLKQKI